MNETTRKEISARILWNITHGQTVTEAIDAILGAGTAAKLAGEVYDALRAKAVKS